MASCIPHSSISQPIRTPATLTLKILKQHLTYRCEPTNFVMPQLKPLPDCEGPKLECFIDDITTCDFKLLGPLGSGCHSQVWKAEINGKVYAIKMVRPRYQGLWIYGYLQFDLSDDKVQRHFLPFGNGARRHLASLGNKDPTDVDVIRRTMQHDDLRIPMMAIVKEWVHSFEGTKWVQLIGGDWASRESVKRDIGHLPRLLRNLRELHKSGIVIRDLKWQQYLDGQLVDFSFAWTIPHIFGPESGLRPRWTFESMAAWDLKCFQTILNEFDDRAEISVPRLRKHNLVAWQSDDMYERLRPRPQLYGPALPMLVYDGNFQPMVHHPPFDPAKFNWRAVQKLTKKGATRRVTKTKAPQRRALREASKERRTK
ncbi:Obg-like ATPase 1 [Fusarium oxysporum f. sp. albedinis]|nr:Obg-like ATPase 1 [Fusarium oxysporum f. sp. albedinis]